MTQAEQSSLGRWWLPGEDEMRDAQVGRLVVGADKTVTVEMHGGFAPMEAGPDGGLRSRSPFPVVFGRCGSEAVTLFSVMAMDSRGGAADRPESQTLSPQRTLRGPVHVADPARPTVHGVQLEIDHLLHFSRLSALSLESHTFTTTPGDLRSTGSVTVPHSHTARWRDITFDLKVSFVEFSDKFENPNLHVVKASQRAKVDLRFDSPKTVADADTISKAFQDLITLATNQPCAARATRYKIAEPEPATEWKREHARFRPEFNISVAGRQIFEPDSTPMKDPQHTYLFTLDDVGFQEVVSRWFDLFGRAEQGVQMLLGTRYLDVGFVSSRLTTVCVALEALHVSLYDEQRMSETEFADLLAAALGGVDDLGQRSLIEQQLGNRISYNKRARRLANKLRASTRRLLLGDPKRWARMVTVARNDLAHANDSELEFGQQLFLTLVTQLLLSLVLAAELGVSEERLHEAVQASWGLTTRWMEVTGQSV